MVLLIFVVYLEKTVKPAPAEEALNKRYPAHNSNERIGPSGIKLRRQRAKPPKSEREAQNPIHFS